MTNETEIKKTDAVLDKLTAETMTELYENDIRESVHERNWNRCKSFMNNRKRMVTSITISLFTIVLFSVFLSVVMKSQYQHEYPANRNEIEEKHSGRFGIRILKSKNMCFRYNHVV